MKSFRERSVRKVSIFDTLGYNKWVFQILTGSWSTLFIISYICFTLSPSVTILYISAIYCIIYLVFLKGAFAMGLILGLVIGGVIGWLAGQIMNAPGGIIRNVILGIVGGFVGNWLFGLLGISWGGIVGMIAVPTIGAVVLIVVINLLF
jgi:uncharacterized membrane protein YeaQ/YmgE (transglycosylase-associated protein family)